jgi:tripartite-type tricarboxylate transporter receptor subunit TctC
MMMRRLRAKMMFPLVVPLLALAMTLSAPSVLAQTYPTKPVRIVVPFTPGGTADFLARLLGQKFSESWGQQVVVDNRAGGGTVIGTEIVARAPADGHTLLVMANSFAINPGVRSSLPYDTLKDFAPVTLLVGSPQVLVVHPAVPARTFGEFLALARSQPGQTSYATVGPGTTQHIAGEMLWSAAKVQLVYAPYSGGAPAVNALLGGHVNSVIANYSEVAQQIEAGKIRPLAVSSRERVDALKDVPTIAESGFRDFEAIAWFGLVAPGATPREVIGRINTEALRALKLPDVREKIIAQGMYPVGNAPEQFAAHIRSEMAKYAKVVKEAGIKAD